LTRKEKNENLRYSQRFWRHTVAVPLAFHYPLVSETVTFLGLPLPFCYHFFGTVSRFRMLDFALQSMAKRFSHKHYKIKHSNSRNGTKKTW